MNGRFALALGLAALGGAALLFGVQKAVAASPLPAPPAPPPPPPPPKPAAAPAPVVKPPAAPATGQRVPTEEGRIGSILLTSSQRAQIARESKDPLQLIALADEFEAEGLADRLRGTKNDPEVLRIEARELLAKELKR